MTLPVNIQSPDGQSYVLDTISRNASRDDIDQWITKVIKQVIPQDSAVLSQGQVVGLIAKAYTKQGTEGFQLAQKLLVASNAHNESVISAIIVLRANERTLPAYREAALFFREIVPHGTAVDSPDYLFTSIFLKFVSNLLGGNKVPKAAKRLSVSSDQNAECARKKVLRFVADEEIKKGNMESAAEVEKLLQ